MKITSVWRGNKASQKKKRSVPKVRIRWSELGLLDPAIAPQETPMDEIRREVTALASLGFGAETRARSEQAQAHASRTGSSRKSPRAKKR
ncbi:MAG: hypothetical protein KF814_04210 [Nitrospiraceae bacterium]|nr:hypothetical protein [Nitrospiraceae bacterium]